MSPECINECVLIEVDTNWQDLLMFFNKLLQTFSFLHENGTF